MLAAITLGFLAIAGLRLADGPWLMLAAGMLGWAVTETSTGTFASTSAIARWSPPLELLRLVASGSPAGEALARRTESA